MKKVIKVTLLSLGMLCLVPTATFAQYIEGEVINYEDGMMHTMMINDKEPLIIPSQEITQNKVINHAKMYLGEPYTYGGKTPNQGFDASGFVQYVYGKSNVTLKRTVKEQFTMGEKVDKEDLNAGDLVYFDTKNKKAKQANFVGIYIGDNKIIAVTTKKGVAEINLKDKYWSGKYVGARKVLD